MGPRLDEPVRDTGGNNASDISELRRELVRVQARYRKSLDYCKAKEHLKGLRKKLFDKRIWDTVNAEVCQLSARFALQYCDTTEYEECEAELVLLRRDGIRTKHDNEFAAYRLLYKLCCDEMKNQKKGEKGEMVINNRGSGRDQRRTAMKDSIHVCCAYRSFLAIYASLSAEEKRSPAVKHVVACAKALSSGSYHTFLLLWKTMPDMGGYLLDHIIERERLLAMEVIYSAYKPTVPLLWLTKELSFSGEDEARDTFRGHGCVILQAEDGEVLDVGSSEFSIAGTGEIDRKRRTSDALGTDDAKPEEIPENWSEHYETQYDAPYYYNRVTKKSTWQKPPVLSKTFTRR